VPIHLYNTLTRRKEAFAPIDPKNVRMYVCGPTVYDFAHIGNARPVVVFDILFRLLRHVYGDKHVTYIRNFTDVDDKIIQAAAKTGEAIGALTIRTAKAYEEDMGTLGALTPTQQPRATGHIAEMIALIQTLIEKGFAYAAEGHALFHVPAMAEYGQLSRHSPDELIAGARVEVAPYKKSPSDFVLWKPSKEGEPGWDSPWGKGRPGWHIECSAMAKKLLGVTFDIHGGGLDLIFPHHENEIAQSRCAHDGAPLARYWMHNGFVQIAGDKMSKSLGNFFTVHELIEEGYRGEAIRLALMAAHYRQPLDISRDAIKDAKEQLDRFYIALDKVRDIPPETMKAPPLDVLAALEDDLNTPMALSHLHEALRALNTAASPTEKSHWKAVLLADGKLLGLLWNDPAAWLRQTQLGVFWTSALSMTHEEIQHLVDERILARRAKEFAASDEIRKKLSDAGVILEDKPDGTTEWRVK
jgi:cysteinyl-tRNA synthetase